MVRITTKIVKGDESRLYQVYVNGKITPLLISWDRTMKEWDLSTDADFIMASHSKGSLLRRMDVLVEALGLSS